MATKNQVSTASGPLDAPVTIPNPPGGGSWTWDGQEWVSNDPIEQPAEPAVPAQTEE